MPPSKGGAARVPPPLLPDATSGECLPRGVEVRRLPPPSFGGGGGGEPEARWRGPHEGPPHELPLALSLSLMIFLMMVMIYLMRH